MPGAGHRLYYHATYCWRETFARCKAMAGALERQGIGREDRVAYLGYNTHWGFELFFSVPWLAAIVVPVNFRLSLREMVECIEDSEPKILVVDEHHVEQALAIQRACPGMETLIYAGSGDVPDGMVSYDDLLLQAAVPTATPGGNDDTLILFYTGGTTGRSKGVMLSHINQFANAMGGISLYQLQEGETHLLAGPMFHTAAGSRVYTATLMGIHTVILSRFDVVSVMELVHEYRINTTQIVPTMLQMLLDHPRFPEFDLSSLRLITYGGAPMPVALMERALRVLPGTGFGQSYGMTEASPVVSVLNSDDHSLAPERRARLVSVGRAAPHVNVRVVGPDRRRLGSGEVGEIAVRGANIMKGYWRAPELTRAVLEDGWYYTGDSGFLDDDGYLFLVGRMKDMIVSGGENVYPIEIENILSRHPDVKECAVIGVPHEKWGESVHAVIRVSEDACVSGQDIIDYCRARIAHYKCPTAVTFMEQPLPVSTVNKILKTELKKMIAGEIK
ncbi:class I adenylate-forming enzyme family protein [Marinobacter aromaticivorans]|uniref:Class I adenylate-forming enzyme family protein n=1 Tax=Marinobacter aromaticivorans TaxID=1494078 RepID=A0ABW2IZL4_9GAMM|nr:AMP-binding protein [Marinobacter aromaticivorans]